MVIPALNLKRIVNPAQILRKKAVFQPYRPCMTKWAQAYFLCIDDMNLQAVLREWLAAECRPIGGIGY
jgi:hypothetical protein